MSTRSALPEAPGLHRISEHCHAFLQPNGYGLNNTGLVDDGDMSLLVDTLMDVPRTRGMLDRMATATPAAHSIDVLVNTHSHVDHTLGNVLLEGSRIVMTTVCAEEMAAMPPDQWIARAAALTGDARQMMDELLGDKFDFEGVAYVAPTETFDEALELRVGRFPVSLIEFGACHTRSDTIVHVPEDGVVYAGDLLFTDSHVPLNYPDIGNWIEACRTVERLDPQIVVPGHGYVTTVAQVTQLREYLEYLRGEARRHFDAGRTPREGAQAIFESLDRFAFFDRADILLPNLVSLYAEFSGEPRAGSYAKGLEARWEFRATLRGKAPSIPHLHAHRH